MQCGTLSAQDYFYFSSPRRPVNTFYNRLVGTFEFTAKIQLKQIHSDEEGAAGGGGGACGGGGGE